MATSNHTVQSEDPPRYGSDRRPTVFKRMAEIHSTLLQAREDTKQLRDSITVPDEAGNAREQAIDLQRQLAHAARDLEELVSPDGLLVPEPKHIDQAVRHG